jgi:hypothetical protein
VQLATGLLTACALWACAADEKTPDPAQPSWTLGPDNWPTTCDDAAVDIVAFLTPKARDELRGVPENDLILLHHGLGMTIRNRQGFWRGNTKLIESCSGSPLTHPDDASFEVVRRAWARVQSP